MLELPPRARRIHTAQIHKQGPKGTTSACAENTARLNLRLRLLRNYLRVRGEYSLLCFALYPLAELPPRARRILVS